MNIFERIISYFSNRKQNKIDRCTRLIANPKAIRDDRLYALEYLRGLDDPEKSVPVLLKRFDYSLEHGINDAREKDIALAGIEKHGEAANVYVREHLRSSTRIAWPIKILKKINSTGAMVDILVESLNFNDVSFDQAMVDRNYDILCYLSDYDLGGQIKKIKHFLADPDERVRFAAVEVMIRSTEEGLQEDLESFIFDDTSENRRIRATVIDLFIQKSWKLSPTRPIQEGVLAENYYVNKDGTIRQS